MLRLKLKDIYEERGTTQRETHEATGIREGTLSAYANGFRKSWDVELLERLLQHFEIEDIRELIEYKKE